MKPVRIRMAGVLAFALISAVASAADYPAPKEGDWVARDFRFHTGEVMPELRLRCGCKRDSWVSPWMRRGRARARPLKKNVERTFQRYSAP